MDLRVRTPQKTVTKTKHSKMRMQKPNIQDESQSDESTEERETMRLQSLNRKLKILETKMSMQQKLLDDSMISVFGGISGHLTVLTS